MSFEDLVPTTKGKAERTPVRVGMSQMRQAPARMSVVVGAELVQGWGASYKLSLGKAEDRHLLKIAADPGGLFQPGEIPGLKKDANKAATGGGNGGFVRFLLPPHDRFPATSVKLQAASFERDEKRKVLLVTLPAWAWDD